MLDKQTAVSAIWLSTIAERFWHGRLRRGIAQVDTEDYALISFNRISLSSLYINSAKPVRSRHCCQVVYTFNL